MTSNVECFRIAILGDKYVGKTTLIASFVEEAYVEHVRPVFATVEIGSDSDNNRRMKIVDTPGLSLARQMCTDTQKALTKEIQKSHAVVLVYDINSNTSFGRVSSFWIPFINSGNKQPIILVGNKIDRKDPRGRRSDLVRERIRPVMTTYSNVETHMESSSVLFHNVSEIFYHTYKTLMYPSNVLCDAKTEEFTEAFLTAIKRIFKISDRNNDGFLDYEELCILQNKCFQHELEMEEYITILANIQIKTGQDIKTARGIMFTEFHTLLKIIIQCGNVHYVWKILDRFGYNKDLYMNDDYLYRPLVDIEGRVYRLSPESKEFLNTLFHTYSKEDSSFLTTDEIEDIFNISPNVPWQDEINPYPNGEGRLTLDEFLSLWNNVCLTKPKLVVFYLNYLGFDDPQIQKIEVVEESMEKNRKGHSLPICPHSQNISDKIDSCLYHKPTSCVSTQEDLIKNEKCHISKTTRLSLSNTNLHKIHEHLKKALMPGFSPYKGSSRHRLFIFSIFSSSLLFSVYLSARLLKICKRHYRSF